MKLATKNHRCCNTNGFGFFLHGFDSRTGHQKTLLLSQERFFRAFIRAVRTFVPRRWNFLVAIFEMSAILVIIIFLETDHPQIEKERVL